MYYYTSKKILRYWFWFRFDAITQLRNRSTYAFLGNQFWRLSASGIEEGFPQSIESVWGIRGSIDAALTYGDITDLFKVSYTSKDRNLIYELLR